LELIKKRWLVNQYKIINPHLNIKTIRRKGAKINIVHKETLKWPKFQVQDYRFTNNKNHKNKPKDICLKRIRIIKEHLIQIMYQQQESEKDQMLKCQEWLKMYQNITFQM
jgi:hypothetical protein